MLAQATTSRRARSKKIEERRVQHATRQERRLNDMDQVSQT